MVENQAGQDELRILLDQPRDHGRVHQTGGVGQKQGNEGERKIQQAPENRPRHRYFPAARRHHALEYVLLGNGAEHHGDPRGDKGEHIPGFKRRPEFEFPCRVRMLHHPADAARHVADQIGDIQQAHHDNAHLEKIRQRH